MIHAFTYIIMDAASFWGEPEQVLNSIHAGSATMATQLTLKL